MPFALDQAALATTTFLIPLQAAPLARVQARVASADGMPLLCAVEAALARALPRDADRELVWLTGSPPQGGVETLHLRAYGEDGALLAETAHAFRSEAGPTGLSL